MRDYFTWRYTFRYGGGVMRDVSGSRYNFLVDHAHDEWVAVYGGDLPVAVDVRIGRAPDGRHVLTGLRVGVAVPAEVTAQLLREIKPAEILADYFNTFRPDIRAEILALAASMSTALPKTSPRGPDVDALKAFAVTYMTELARQPYRAMTAAAKAHSISRATANRWAALCRQYGYLPAMPDDDVEPG